MFRQHIRAEIKQQKTMIQYSVKKVVVNIGKHKGKTMYYAAPATQDKITSR